jgi:hypothetical protein
MLLFLSLLYGIQASYAQTNYYVNPSGNDGNSGTASGTPKKSIQAALDAIAAIPLASRDASGYIVNITAGNYNETVVIKTAKTTLQGAGSGTHGQLEPDAVNTSTQTVISGVGLGNVSGIVFSGTLTDVTIRDLVVADFAQRGISSTPNSNNLLIANVQANNNAGQAGIFVAGPVKNVTIDNSAAINNAGRAIVVWDGYKEDITIQNNYVVLGGCCGIELQDGTASGVNINNNTVKGTPSNGDSAISAVGLKSGGGANIISSNNIELAKRYGIEIKNPAGSGSETETADGAIIIKDNNITRTGSIPSETRDLAGIAIFRRAFLDKNSYNYVDVPSGVVISNNNITGFRQTNVAGEGYGIVAEGVRITIKGNTVSDCDIAIQRQAGNPSNYVKNDEGDSDQIAAGNAYFNRGNAPFSSAIVVGANTFNSNTTDTRDEFAANTYLGDGQFVYNSSTKVNYASIALAVEAASATNTLELSENTFDERVVIDKAITIDGLDNTKANVTYTGAAITTNGNGVPTIFTVASPNVSLKNINFIVNLDKVHSAIHSYGDVSGISITDNNFVAAATGTLVSGKLAYTRRNAVSINIDAYDADYSNVNTGISNVTIQRNAVQGFIGGNIANGGFRGGFQVDRAKNVLIGGNTNADANIVQTINHDVICRFFTDGDVTVKHNQFNGGGVEMSSANSASGTVTIEENTFDGTASNAYTSQARFQANTFAKTFVLKNNIFSNTKWGVSLENFRNISIEGNTLTPAVNDFRLITVNTKMISSTDAGPTFPIALSLTGNTFNGLSTATLGKAVAFYNHKEDGSGNYLGGDVNLGEAGAPNSFNADIPTYVYVDDDNGNATKDGSNVGLPGFPEYGSNIAITTTGYWKKDIIADENNFYVDGQLRSPYAMSVTQKAELDTKIYDKKDESNIGQVQYFLPVTNATTSVKYASIQAAVDAANAGDEINTRPGEYLENVVLNKQNLKLIGPGADQATIKGAKVAGGTTVSLAQTGVVLEGFTVTRDGNNTTDWNGNLNNQGVSMDADYTTARKVLITGNRNGLYVNNRKNVLVEHCDITNNRTGVQAANDITGTVIKNNNITDNWTLGFLYILPSNPSAGMGQTISADIVKNNITGNWFSQIEFRTDNINVLNFGANNLGQGSGAIDIVATASGEPGYASQIPVAFGGSAVPPASALMISGLHSDKIDYSVTLPSFTDLDAAIGYQPDSSVVWVNEASPVAAGSPKLTSASTIVAPNGTILIKDATLSSGGEISKDVTLDADAAAVTINGDLTVNTTTLTLAKPTTIGGQFTLTAGKVVPMDEFVLNGAITTNADIANFIDGAVTVNNVAADILVPIGKGSKAAYAALSNTAGAASSFTFEYFPAAFSSSAKEAALDGVSSTEYWTVNRTLGTLAANVRLYTFDIAASGLTSGNMANTVVARYSTTNSQWETLGNGGYVTVGPSYVTADIAVGDFYGDLTFGTTPAVLPVSLASFEAKATAQGATLSWITLSEYNNAKFEIEKSTDGKKFGYIGEQLGKVNSAVPSNYQFVDQDFRQSAYYRLVQVDNNGKKTTYDQFVRFVKALDKGFDVLAYPNPVTSKLFVDVSSPKKEEVKLLLIDMTGKTLLVKNADSEQPIELDVAKIATGSYILQVIKASGNMTKKISKL